MLLFFFFRNGSIVVDFLLKFSQKVLASKVLSALREAAKGNKFGNFRVNPNSITLISPSPSPSSTEITSTESTSTESTSTKGTVHRVTEIQHTTNISWALQLHLHQQDFQSFFQ